LNPKRLLILARPAGEPRDGGARIGKP
jgi:hypothetical protein